MSELSKITGGHRRRRAVVYVRQSTADPGGTKPRVTGPPVRASQARDRARLAGGLGHRRREDLGRSGPPRREARDQGAGRRGRPRASRARPGAGGLASRALLGRLASAARLCALTATLIADSDGIYSPQEFNDRLLLGLKGTMSEAELHLIRARLRGRPAQQGRARRAGANLPVGLDRDEDGAITLAADEQVREVIGPCLLALGGGSAPPASRRASCSARTGSCRAARPARSGCGGPARATRGARNMLTNPAYAGAFVFGRTRHEKRSGRAGRVRA